MGENIANPTNCAHSLTLMRMSQVTVPQIFLLVRLLDAGFSLYIYVCGYICIYVHVHLHIYKDTYVCLCVCEYVYTYICVNMYMCIYVYVTHICIFC